MVAPQEVIERGASAIAPAFADSVAQPFFIGRNGTIEMEVLGWYIQKRRTLCAPTSYPGTMLQRLELHAGIWPATEDSVDAWAEEYLTGMGQLTGVAAGWYPPLKVVEGQILAAARLSPGCFQCPLRSLEPYYYRDEMRWTAHLKGKRVAVVTSFADTVRDQIGRLDEIWPADGEQAGIGLALQSVGEWHLVQTGYAPNVAEGRAEWAEGVRDWETAAEHVVRQVLASGAEIALIGCGGLSMIIGARLRAAGVSVLVLGGAIQILFGIRGYRWMRHDVISKFFNDAWRWPKESETPGRAGRIEGACYWRPA